MAKMIVTFELDFGEEKDFDYVCQTADSFVSCDYQWNDLIDEVGGYDIVRLVIEE